MSTLTFADTQNMVAFLDRMQLHELMNLCTKLSDRVLALETTKTIQALEIASLKSRVKHVKPKNLNKHLLLLNYLHLNSRRNSLEGAKKGTIKVSQSSASTEPMTEKETNEESVPNIPMIHLKVTTKTTQALEIANLKSRVKKLEKQASKRTHKHDVYSDKEVSAAEILTTAGITIPDSTAEIKTSVAPSTIAVSPHVITEVEITLVQTLDDGGNQNKNTETTTRTPTSVSSSSIKDKGKAKMIETKVPLNKKDQIMLDEELARRLDAKEQEATRLERENIELQEQATLAKIEEWDNVQAMMDVDYKLCKILQGQEQCELTIEEKSKLFMELMNERKRHFAKLKNKSYEEIQKAFDKTMGWINNFKPMDSEEVKRSKKKVEGSRKKSIGKKRAWNEQKQESSKRQRMEDDKEIDEHEEVNEDDEAEMKKHMEIVQDDKEIEFDAIPLATNPPMIFEYKIVKEGQEGFYHLIRADRSSNRPKDDYEIVLWGDLKVMFEPDIKSEVWRNL
ncbi:hypothetical protein Tco_0347234 [Tanacetum coccineum]